MDNRNLFTQIQQPNGYYPYYPAAAGAYTRPEAAAYMIPQPAPAAVIKGRPVSSLEEARVAQIDLDGSISFFPDLGNKRIYTKRINADGTASINTYSLDEQVPVAQTEEYVTRGELTELKKSLDDVIKRLSGTSSLPSNQTTQTQKPTINF